MSNLSATAAKMLAEYGEAVSVLFPAYGDTDPITGAATTGGSDVTLSGNGYPSQYHKRDIDGSVIQAGDIRLILERIDQRPEVGCIATVNGVGYRVMDTQMVRLAGADVVYICQLRAN
jgi:hypothetical protein